MIEESISGYTNDDVVIVLKKTYENALNDRDEALSLYVAVKKKIEGNSPDTLFLLQKANELLETINKNNEILVRLAGVMQRLQTNTIIKRKSSLLDSESFNKLLESMDKQDDSIKKIAAKFLVENNNKESLTSSNDIRS